METRTQVRPRQQYGAKTECPSGDGSENWQERLAVLSSFEEVQT